MKISLAMVVAAIALAFIAANAGFLTAWYLAIVGLVGHRFWDYWSTLI